MNSLIRDFYVKHTLDKNHESMDSRINGHHSIDLHPCIFPYFFFFIANINVISLCYSGRSSLDEDDRMLQDADDAALQPILIAEVAVQESWNTESGTDGIVGIRSTAQFVKLTKITLACRANQLARICQGLNHFKIFTCPYQFLRYH